MRNKAIFLDRDGVIIKLVYNIEFGLIHTPLTPQQVELNFGIVDFLKSAKKAGFLLIVISNQPNIGIKKMSEKQFQAVIDSMNSKLKKNGVVLDAEYYCLHHPFAEIKKYRKKCTCRKPKILLYKKALKKFAIDIKRSWAIGDGVFDIVAGKTFGVKTILLANINEAAYFETLEKQLNGTSPDYIIKNIKDAKKIIE